MSQTVCVAGRGAHSSNGQAGAAGRRILTFLKEDAGPAGIVPKN
jgi:hypothetical protein